MRRTVRRPFLWALVAWVCPWVCLGPALAAEAGDGSAPLVFNVRPSRAEGAGAERQERLLRRARDLDFAFWAICIGCGTTAGNAGASGAAFSPHGVLAARPNRPADAERQTSPERTEAAGPNE